MVADTGKQGLWTVKITLKILECPVCWSRNTHAAEDEYRDTDSNEPHKQRLGDEPDWNIDDSHRHQHNEYIPDSNELHHYTVKYFHDICHRH